MHYVAMLDGVEREIEVIELASGRYRVTIDGRPLEVDARAVDDRTLSLIVDGASYAVQLDRDGKGEAVVVRGQRLHAEMLDLRELRLRRAKSLRPLEDGPVTVTSPMPGKIVAVLVRDGDAVQEGQGLVVVEAMKMENELKSPKTGRVRQVSAQAGAAVEAGAPLCAVE